MPPLAASTPLGADDLRPIVSLHGQGPAFDFGAESSVNLLDDIRYGGQPQWRSESGAKFAIEWKCPSQVASGGAGSGPFESRTCPAYLLDAEDILSHPVLVVDPRNPKFMAFHALHGGPGLQVPTSARPPGPTAREDAVHQPHTVFRTIDGGQMWEDNPYYSPFYDAEAAPDPTGRGPRTWGVDNAMTRDTKGNLYVGSLYVHKPSGSAPPQYVLALWKGEDASRPFTGTTRGLIIEKLEPTSVGSSLHMGFVPESQDIYTYLIDKSSSGAQVVRFWHANAKDNPFRWNEMTLPAEHVCDTVSNPVTADGLVYLACSPVVAKNQKALVKILRIDPGKDWNATVASVAPMESSKNLVLAAAPQWGRGMMALASAGVSGGRPYLLYSYGILGENWRPSLNYGAQVTATYGNPTAQQGAIPTAARVTAMAYSQRSSSFHLIYAERWDVSNAASSSREFTKTYAVIHGGGQFLGTASILYGDAAVQPTAPAHVAGTDTTVWFDEKDSITVFGGGSGERVFVAFGDHGFVRFGEAVAVDSPPAAIPLAAPVSPVPLPLAGMNPALVGAAAGALSLSLLMRMIATKKKATAEAPSL